MAAGDYSFSLSGKSPPVDHRHRLGLTLRETIRHVTPAAYPDLWITSMMGGLSRDLELNTFEIAGDLARTLQAQCSYLAAPISPAASARATPFWPKKRQGRLERIDSVELALSVSAIFLALTARAPRVAERRVGGRPARGRCGRRRARPISTPMASRSVTASTGARSRRRSIVSEKIPTVMLIAGGLNKAPIIAARRCAAGSAACWSPTRTASAALALIDKK